MSVLKRLSTLIKSNVNDAIDALQDPGKEVDQMILDMEDSARKAKREVAACLAEEKRLTKQVETLTAEASAWEEKAMTAVKAGNDALAREALKRKTEIEAQLASTKAARQEQEVQVENLSAALSTLDNRIREVKARRETLKAKARAARDGDPTSTKTSAFAEFDRMSSKIDAIEIESSLDGELSGRTQESVAAERELKSMSEESAVDDALAALKKKLES